MVPCPCGLDLPRVPLVGTKLEWSWPSGLCMCVGDLLGSEFELIRHISCVFHEKIHVTKIFQVHVKICYLKLNMHVSEARSLLFLRELTVKFGI